MLGFRLIGCSSTICISIAYLSTPSLEFQHFSAKNSIDCCCELFSVNNCMHQQEAGLKIVVVLVATLLDFRMS